MQVQKYLQQLKVLDTKIEQKKLQCIELKKKTSNAGAIQYDKEAVQTTKTGDRVEKMIVRYIELENEINDDIQRLQEAKNTIINQIHQMTDDRYMKVLFKKYVEYKSYKLIAIEMSYSFDYVKELHHDALNAFDHQFPTLSHL